MKRLIKFSTALLLASGLFLSSCSKDDNDDNSVLVNFDSLGLAANSYWDGSNGSGGFKVKGVSFPNLNPGGYWSGFAYSNMHDLKTTGYGNQYSCYAQNDSSKNTFALYYQYTLNTIVFDEPVYDVKLKVTNNTYAALSMKNGDNIEGGAKKFGGANGTDKDWFKLKIVGINASGKSTDSTEVYLADYRDEASKDFILDKWVSVDLSKLKQIKKLKFELSSSDNGTYGMNTPAYFCMDDLEYKPVSN